MVRRSQNDSSPRYPAPPRTRSSSPHRRPFLVSPVSLSSSISSAPVSSLPSSILIRTRSIRSSFGVSHHAGRQIDAQQIDADISYLTSQRLTATPWARVFFIEAAMPFSQKRLREKLRSMNVGRVTIKKRGSPLDVDEFARSLKLKGDEERIIFLTHVKGEAWVLVGQSASPPTPSPENENQRHFRERG